MISWFQAVAALKRVNLYRYAKGLPVKGAGAATDAQIEAAKARVARWKMVNLAVGGMNYHDAACGTDNLLTNEPATSSQMFDRGGAVQVDP